MSKLSSGENNSSMVTQEVSGRAQCDADTVASVYSLQISPNPAETGIKSCISYRMTWERLSENSSAIMLVDHQGPLDPLKFFLKVEGEPQEGPGC